MIKKITQTKPWQLDLALLVLRVAGGAFMITHGYGKLEKLVSGKEIDFISFMGLSPALSLGLTVFAEFVCAALLVLGLFSRLALIPLIVAMSVAVFDVHIADPFAKAEKAALFLSIYVTLLLAGPGKYSIDRLLAGK